MNTILPSTAAVAANPATMTSVREPNLKGKDNAELRQAFDTFVGENFFGQMIKAMRKSTGKPAYFHGGRAEEIFQQQLDQTMAADIAKSSADQFTGPMYDLFTLQRK
jgi:Rod binding domain-containing protein